MLRMTRGYILFVCPHPTKIFFFNFHIFLNLDALSSDVLGISIGEFNKMEDME
jgi:hypothetical protein